MNLLNNNLHPQSLKLRQIKILKKIVLISNNCQKLKNYENLITKVFIQYSYCVNTTSGHYMNTVKQGYSAHAFNEFPFKVKIVSYHFMNWTDKHATNYIYNEWKIIWPWHFAISMFYGMHLIDIVYHFTLIHSKNQTLILNVR